MPSPALKFCQHCGCALEGTGLRRFCFDCKPLAPKDPKEKKTALAVRPKDKNLNRLALTFALAAPADKLKMIVRVMRGDIEEISPEAKRLFLIEATRLWLEKGDRDMGKILMNHILPQKSEHLKTADVGDNMLEGVKAMQDSEKQKLLEQALRSPVKADFEVVK